MGETLATQSIASQRVDLDRIYLDNAATSWPKPEAVYVAVDHYQREIGAPAGRSAYAEASEVGRIVDATRRKLARLFSVADPDHMVFTCSGTDALNLAIHGILREGDHVVTSVVEHNSVLRPLRALEDAGTIELSIVGCGSTGIVDPDAIRKAITPRTRLIAITHASNVTGAVQPAAEIGRLAKEHELVFLLDAAQTAGHMPIAVDELQVDLLAAPCHKALLAPLGMGMLYIRPGVEGRLTSLRQGGTGTRSDQDRQPDLLPGKYEAGNLNVPGIVGLSAALDYLDQEGVGSIARRQQQLLEQLTSGLREIAGVRVYGAPTGEAAALVSVTMDDYDPQELAATLDSAFRIQVRSGLHCAPLMHRALGTDASGGTLRFSLGPFNRSDHIESVLGAVSQIASTSLAH